jgi:hypothetical protein
MHACALARWWPLPAHNNNNNNNNNRYMIANVNSLTTNSAMPTDLIRLQLNRLLKCLLSPVQVGTRSAAAKKRATAQEAAARAVGKWMQLAAASASAAAAAAAARPMTATTTITTTTRTTRTRKTRTGETRTTATAQAATDGGGPSDSLPWSSPTTASRRRSASPAIPAVDDVEAGREEVEQEMVEEEVEVVEEEVEVVEEEVELLAPVVVEASAVQTSLRFLTILVPLPTPQRRVVQNNNNKNCKNYNTNNKNNNNNNKNNNNKNSSLSISDKEMAHWQQRWQVAAPEVSDLFCKRKE